MTTRENLLPVKTSRALAIWGALLFGLTSLAVAWLWLTSVNPNTDFSPVIILIAYSPSLAALLTAMLPGGGGLRALLKPLLIWRVSLKWYALALLGPLTLVAIALFLYMLFGGDVSSGGFTIPAASAIGSLIGPLIAGSLGEELGWRAFAQRLLQKRYSLLWSCIIVGILWATWHLWPILAPGGAEYSNASTISETYIRLIATAIIYGWIYVRTGGSVLLVMVTHAGHNIAIDLITPSLLSTVAIPLLITVLYALAAIWLLAAQSAQFFQPAQKH